MLVHEAIADQLIERVAGAVAVLDVGQADELGDRGAAGDRARRPGARRALRRRSPQREGRIAARARAGARPRLVLPADGRGRPPARLAGARGGDLRPAAGDRAGARRRARPATIVDGLPFALTGGLFARDPPTVRYVRARTPVGNLYVNRGITGAMVGRQPFGGNRLSGTGTKAGGPDYLLPLRRAAGA